VKPSAYASERKAFQTEAGVLLDEPKSAYFKIKGDNTIQRPDSERNKLDNDFLFDTILKSRYGLAPATGTLDWERP
jgi:hypothetical protein